MKKKLLLSISCLLISAGIFAAAIPGALSIKGSALNESDNTMAMKRVGNSYEVYTSLKTGSYSFEGDNAVQGGEITVEGSNVPYYIQVNYDGDTPEVMVSQVSKAELWVPWTKYTAAELTYKGNSTFTADNIVQSYSTWEGFNEDDARYRFRMHMENGTLRSYGGNEELELASNEQWGAGDGLEEKNCELPDKYKNTNQRFSVELVLKATEPYTHILTDYDFNPEINPCDEVFIEGSAIAPGKATFKEKSYGVFEFVGELQAGTYKIRGTRSGASAYFANEDDKLIEAEREITFEGEKDAYYIKVDFINAVYEISPVTSFVLYMSVSGEDAEDQVELTYSGNGVYKTTIQKLQWADLEGFGEDERYKFRMKTESGSTIYWGGVEMDPQRPESETGEAYELYSVAQDRYQYPFKFRDNTNGQKIDMTVTFYTDGNYRHSYNVSPVGIETIQDNQIAIYPTIVENELTISLEKPGFSVELVSLAGITVLKAETTSTELTLTNIAQPKSVYLLKVVQDGKTVTVKRIVKL